MSERAMQETRECGNGLGPGESWTHKPDVAGQPPRSPAAYANLKRICTVHLHGTCSCDAIVLLEHPELAAGDHIIAIPTLIRKLPTPVRKISGDLSHTDRVLVGLDLRKRISLEQGA